MNVYADVTTVRLEIIESSALDKSRFPHIGGSPPQKH